MAEENQVSEETVERVVAGGQEAVVAASKKALPSVVNIEVAVTGGTGVAGFIIREDGYILTNNHVIRDGGEITCNSTTAGEFKATKVSGSDPDRPIWR